jgi:Antibiotic biosynthesis monooxygenase
MYISRSAVTSEGETEGELIARVKASHASRLAADGFRWAMLLRSMEDATSFSAVSMWLSPEHALAWREATESPAPLYRYNVVTARGSMTPASAAAIVDWQVDTEVAARFASRWNAAYHSIEDVFGSRLLQEMDEPLAHAGLHVVRDATRLDPAVLSAELTDDDGLVLHPVTVQRFDVVLLTEAD